MEMEHSPGTGTGPPRTESGDGREEEQQGRQEQQRLRALYSRMVNSLEEMSGDPMLLAYVPKSRGEEGPDAPRYDVYRAGALARTLTETEKLRRELYDLPPAGTVWKARNAQKSSGDGEDFRVFLPQVLPEEPPDCPETEI